jgi:hypothetical protein
MRDYKQMNDRLPCRLAGSVIALELKGTMMLFVLRGGSAVVPPSSGELTTAT